MLGLEAGQGLALVVESADQIQQTQGVECQQRAATRSYEPQVAAPISQRETHLSEDAEAGTIDMAQIGEIQHTFVLPVRHQFCQLPSQQLALTVADRCPALKVNYGDVTGFT